MKQPIDRDIWVIVFDDAEECWLLVQQLKSLIHFKNSLDFNIIINEDDTSNVINLLEKYKFFDVKSSADFNINIYSKQDIIGTNGHLQGYITQQILKLNVFRKSKCKESVILDAKNIALIEDPLREFVPKAHNNPPHNYFGCWEHCLDRWHSGKVKAVRPTTTPYLFDNEILKKLRDDFKSDHNYYTWLKKPFVTSKPRFQHFDKQVNGNKKVHSLSEFMIYNLFEQSITPNYDKINKRIEKAVTNNLLQETNCIFIFDGVYKKQHHSNPSFISMHRTFVKEQGFARSENLINQYIYGPN